MCVGVGANIEDTVFSLSEYSADFKLGWGWGENPANPAVESQRSEAKEPGKCGP